jgi:hypothetical protein
MYESEKYKIPTADHPFSIIFFGQSSPEMIVRIKSKFNSDWKFILDDKSGFDPAILSLQA